MRSKNAPAAQYAWSDTPQLGRVALLEATANAEVSSGAALAQVRAGTETNPADVSQQLDLKHP